MKVSAVCEWAETASIEEIAALENEISSSAKKLEKDIMANKIDDDEYRLMKSRAETLRMMMNRKKYGF